MVYDMKKFIMGFLVGAFIFVPASIFAASNIEKIEAYINNDVKIEIDGKPFVSEFPILVYEKRTYLPLRTVGEDIMGKSVDWDSETQTVLMTSIISEEDAWPVNDTTQTIESNVEETTYEGLKALISDGAIYFDLVDYNNKSNNLKWGFDSETNIIYLAGHKEGSTEISEKFVEVDRDDPEAVFIYKGRTHISTKYYR
jgi:hypothetical protein